MRAPTVEMGAMLIEYAAHVPVAEDDDVIEALSPHVLLRPDLHDPVGSAGGDQA